MTKPLERTMNPDAMLEPRPRKFTVEEYERAYRDGILPETPKTELIDGVIYTMPPMAEEHAFSLRTLNARLVLGYSNRAEVQQQSPLRLPDLSEPEPDFALLRPGSPGIPFAQDVFWLIEVGKTTYSFDRDTKLPQYALHGIPEVWIVNLNQNRLEVYLNPSEGEAGVFAYADPIIYEPGQVAAPLAFPEDGLEWW